MTSNHTKHSAIRSQQRAIPPLILQLLDEFGHREYDKHGGAKVFFTRSSIRNMERQFGRRPVARLRDFFTTYFVESTDAHATLTVGHRTKRFRRN